MLELKHIYKSFNQNTVNQKDVFKDLNLKVEDGDFITIIGTNGAGKSTLFNLIGGSFFPDSGEIYLEDKNITFMEPHLRSKQIGRLFQDPKLGTASKMSIEENLYLASGKGGWLSLVSKKDKEFFKEELAKLNMGLEDRLKQPVGLLSGGQRQALTLLMATINPPKILLLDEHTAALDPKAAEQILKITDEVVNKNKITCLMVTHDMNTALKMGNRLIMMMDGKIIVDVKGEEKKKLSVEELLSMFKKEAGNALLSDRTLLS